MESNFHHHFQNTCINAVGKYLSHYLAESFGDDLFCILAPNCILTDFVFMFCAIDKEFSLPCNYPKGHCKLCYQWLKEHFPDILLVEVKRTPDSKHYLLLRILVPCIGTITIIWTY